MALKEWPQDKQDEIMRFMRFLSDRATGRIPTGASFIRSFVMNHADYQRDSKVTDQINFDLLKMLSTLNDAECQERRDLLGEYA